MAQLDTPVLNKDFSKILIAWDSRYKRSSSGVWKRPDHATLSAFLDSDTGRRSPPLRKLEYQRAEFLTYLARPLEFMSTPHRP
jgi:hypothetical protein